MDYMLERLRLLPPISVVFDIGAYKGEFTKAVKSLWKDCTVWQFEADERLAKHLQDPIISLLGDEHNKAVNFYTLPENNITTGSSIFRENTSYYKDPVIVTKTMTTIDEVSKRYNFFPGDWEESGLIKIDTQGSEILILKGAQNFLARNKPKYILLEASLVEYNLGGPLIAEMFEAMSLLNYTPYDIFGNFYGPEKRLYQVDVLFERKK